MLLGLSGLLSGSACFEDTGPDACTPGRVNCSCDAGACQSGLQCIDAICRAGGDASSSTTASASTTAASGTTDAASGTTDAASSSTGETMTTTADGGTITGGSTGTTGGPATEHILFLTSSTIVGGEIGSVEGGDDHCALVANDDRSWRAILSDSNGLAADRIEISGPVFNTNGELLARDAAGLWTAPLLAAPTFDESGGLVEDTELAWVGSIEDNCADWNTDAFDDLADFGVPSMENLWLNSGSTFQCGLPLHLYCISVP